MVRGSTLQVHLNDRTCSILGTLHLLGNHYVSAFGYADDIILLCPSLQGMGEMEKICEDYATRYNILFNGKKIVYPVSGNYKYNVSLTIKNEKVYRSDIFYIQKIPIMK